MQRKQRFYFLLLIVTIVPLAMMAQPRWNWVRSLVGPTFDEVTSLAQGPDGNLHVTGPFSDSISVNGLVVRGVGNYDAYTARFNKNGNVVDADVYGGYDADDSRSIAVDNKGNIYVCGSFFDQVLISGEVFDAVGTFGGDMFLAKFDKTGVLQWANVFGSEDYDEVAPYVAVDSLGSVYLAGGFGETGIFGNKTLQSAGSSDIFVIKLSALGEVIWARGRGGAELDEAKAISVSPNGDRIYVTSTFSGSAMFGSKQLVSFFNKMDFAVEALSADGAQLWLKRIGHAEDDRYINTTADATGNLLITGAMSGKMSFDQTVIEANGEFFPDMFLTRMTKAGAFDFIKHFGGPYSDVGLAVATDAKGAIFVGGYFDSSSVYDGYVVTSEGGNDAFIARFFSTGEFEWIRTAGGPYDDEGRGVAVSPDGIPYLAGVFDTYMDFSDLARIEGRFVDGFVAALECGPNTAFIPKVSSVTICEGQDSIISVKAGYPNYQWFANGTSLAGETRFRLNLNKLPMGQHKIAVRVTDFYSCERMSDTIDVTVTEGLPMPLITQAGNALECSVSGMMYQWYLEGKIIEGATDRTVVINGNGNYRVLISNEAGCTRWSDNFLVGTSWVSEITGTPVTIYPNPFSDRVTLNGASGYEVTVTDMLGHIVARISDATDMESLVIPGAAGMYVVQLRSAAGTHSMMITKQ
jgi:hypothetical protein